MEFSKVIRTIFALFVTGNDGETVSMYSGCVLSYLYLIFDH